MKIMGRWVAWLSQQHVKKYNAQIYIHTHASGVDTEGRVSISWASKMLISGINIVEAQSDVAKTVNEAEIRQKHTSRD